MGCVDELTDGLGRVNFVALADFDFLIFLEAVLVVCGSVSLLRLPLSWRVVPLALVHQGSFSKLFVTVSFDTTLSDEQGCPRQSFETSSKVSLNVAIELSKESPYQ